MKITNTAKEKMYEFARRAMKQADAMGRIVVAIFNGQETLVYPSDDVSKVLSFIKLHDLERQIKTLA